MSDRPMRVGVFEVHQEGGRCSRPAQTPQRSVTSLVVTDRYRSAGWMAEMRRQRYSFSGGVDGYGGGKMAQGLKSGVEKRGVKWKQAPFSRIPARMGFGETSFMIDHGVEHQHLLSNSVSDGSERQSRVSVLESSSELTWHPQLQLCFDCMCSSLVTVMACRRFL